MPRNTRGSKKNNAAEGDTAGQLLSQITGLEDQVTRQLNEFKNQMSAIQGENKDPESIVSVDDLSNRFVSFENNIMSTIGSIKKQIHECFTKTNNRINGLIQKTHENKLLIYGVAEAKDEDLYSAVFSLIKTKMNTPIERAEINSVYRYGRVNNARSRPVVVDFVSLWKRNSIFYKKSALKNSRLVMAEFLTSELYDLFKAVRAKMQNDCWTKNGKVVFLWKGKRHYVTSLEEFKSIAAE